MSCEELAKIACETLPPRRLEWEQRRMKNIIRIYQSKADRQTGRQADRQTKRCMIDR